MRRQYTKVREIGAGTFGTAWLVRDLRTGKSFVMKEISLKGLPLKEQRASKAPAIRIEREHDMSCVP
jgi:serine/threonine protein kinase